jgi:O-6-methylguanine DNA methyltransferase
MTFDERVWELIAQVPEGRVTTYRAIARALGTRAYRRVGQACNRSPGMPQVPCHRVVASDGRLHGFASPLERKREMLESEGIAITGESNGMRVDLDRFGFDRFRE